MNITDKNNGTGLKLFPWQQLYFTSVDGESYTGTGEPIFIPTETVDATNESSNRKIEIIKTPPIKNDSTKVGRNDICPCGSGLKFKKCCLQKGE